MGRPSYLTVTLPNDASANGVALSQSLGAAGNLILNGALVSGGVATLSLARRVIIVSAGNDSGITFTIYGTNRDGGTIQETIAGGNVATVTSTQDFKTVTRISGSAATAGNVTSGTSDLASSQWVPWDLNVRTKFEVSVDGQPMTGAAIWSVEVTYDDVYYTSLPPNVPFPRAVAWPGLTNIVGQEDDVIDRPVRGTRLTLSSPGSVMLTQTQMGD